jgi:hypothetical protein
VIYQREFPEEIKYTFKELTIFVFINTEACSIELCSVAGSFISTGMEA